MPMSIESLRSSGTPLHGSRLHGEDIAIIAATSGTPLKKEHSPIRRCGVVASLCLAVTLLSHARTLKFLRSQHSKITEGIFISVSSLLSSSCCLLQLIINAFSFGCAGFAALDIVRPFFLCLTFGALSTRTAYVLGWSPMTASGTGSTSIGTGRPKLLHSQFDKMDMWQLVASWTAATVISFLPEILRLLNRRGGWRIRTGRNNTGQLDELENPAGRPKEVTAVTTMHAIVSGVKCEACASGLLRALKEINSNSNESCDSSFSKPDALVPQPDKILEVTAEWRSKQETRIKLVIQGVGVDFYVSPKSYRRRLSEWAAAHLRSTCAEKGYTIEIN